MLIEADKIHIPSAIHTDQCAIFASLELSRSAWLITSLSPSSRGKMSKHSVPSGDVRGPLERFRAFQERARARTRQLFPLVVIQEARLDGIWIHWVLVENSIESHIVDPAQSSCMSWQQRDRPSSGRDCLCAHNWREI